MTLCSTTVHLRIDHEPAVERSERALEVERLDEHLHPAGRAPARDGEVDPRLVELVNGLDGARELLVHRDERPVDVGEQKADALMT